MKLLDGFAAFTTACRGDFDRDVPTELGVASQVDDSKAAAPQLRLDLISTQSGKLGGQLVEDRFRERGLAIERVGHVGGITERVAAEGTGRGPTTVRRDERTAIGARIAPIAESPFRQETGSGLQVTRVCAVRQTEITEISYYGSFSASTNCGARRTGVRAFARPAPTSRANLAAPKLRICAARSMTPS